MYPKTLRIYALELHVVGHCNLTCVGCSQSSPRVAPRFEDIGRMKRSLANLRGIIACEKLQVLGGEPLLHPGIADLCRAAGESGVGKRVTVKTNGMLLVDAAPDFWHAVDEVLVSVYPATAKRLERFRSGLERVAADTGTRLEFREMRMFNHLTKQSHTSSDRIAQRVFEGCEYKSFSPSLCEGRLYRCAPSVNLQRAGIPISSDDDSIELVSGTHNSGTVIEMLTSKRHLKACHWCLGSSGSQFPHTLGRSRVGDA